MQRRRLPLAGLVIAFACSWRVLVAQDVREGDRAAIAADARLNGQRFERAVSAMQRVLRVWLTHADERTLLLPDRIPGPGSGLKPGDRTRLYTPHNSAADLYPYLILTAELTDPDLYRGRMKTPCSCCERWFRRVPEVPGVLPGLQRRGLDENPSAGPDERRTVIQPTC